MTAAVDQLAQLFAAAMDGNTEFAAKVSEYRRADEPFIDAQEVATYIGTPVKTVRRYAQEGRLTSYPIGRRVMFLRSEVHRDVLARKLAA